MDVFFIAGLLAVVVSGGKLSASILKSRKRIVFIRLQNKNILYRQRESNKGHVQHDQGEIRTFLLSAVYLLLHACM